MDTWWIGPPLKGLASAVIAVAVNGKTILVKVLKPVAPGKPDDPPPPLYRLNLDSQAHRTTLAYDEPQGLWVYASIEVINPPEGFDIVAAAESISFEAEPPLRLSEAQLQGTRKAVQVTAQSSDESSATSATLVAHAYLAGQSLSAPLLLNLNQGYQLVIECRSEYLG